MLEFYLSMVETPEDKSKLEQIYYKYKNLMKYIAMKKLHNEELAEDAVGEALVSLIENLDRIDDVNSTDTKAFIYIVIYRVSLNMYNKAKRQATENIDDYVDMSADINIFDNLYLDDLYKTIISLPPLYRDIIELKFYYDMTNKEIAKTLKISESLVRKRYERAKAILNKLRKEEVENV